MKKLLMMAVAVSAAMSLMADTNGRRLYMDGSHQRQFGGECGTI